MKPQREVIRLEFPLKSCATSTLTSSLSLILSVASEVSYLNSQCHHLLVTTEYEIWGKKKYLSAVHISVDVKADGLW
jgi:hypothetical protein